MKVPSIRFYLEGDYEDVRDLFERHGYRSPDQRGLLGTAMVAHDEESGDLIGFIWALAAAGVPVAYVDHLVIDKASRSSAVGVILMATLAEFLRKSGVEKILAITRPENVALIRMLAKRGAEDLGEFRALKMDMSPSEVMANGK